MKNKCVWVKCKSGYLAGCDELQIPFSKKVVSKCPLCFKQIELKKMICQKCWNDAFNRAYADKTKCQVEHYYDLLKESQCTAKEQAGEYWDNINKCDSRTKK